MPVNKNASFRYRVLNTCFQNKMRQFSLEDLVDKVSEQLSEHIGIDKGVSKRQIQEDISIMRSLPPRGFDAPIICKNGFYFYENPDYSIDQNPLNNDDVVNLKEAIAILKQFPGLPYFENITQVINKLQASISPDVDFIEFEKNINVFGSNLIDPLLNAIKEKKVIDVKYQPFNKESLPISTVHPYLLKEYRNRWFLLGLNDVRNETSIYALDRILTFDVNTKIEYKSNNKWSSEDYFKNIVGVTLPPDSKIQTIEIRCSQKIKGYILTKPLHPSQQVMKDGSDEFIILIKLIPNYEFISLILGFGSEVHIIKPRELSMKIINSLKSTLKEYDTIIEN